MNFRLLTATALAGVTGMLGLAPAAYAVPACDASTSLCVTSAVIGATTAPGYIIETFNGFDTTSFGAINTVGPDYVWDALHYGDAGFTGPQDYAMSMATGGTVGVFGWATVQQQAFANFVARPTGGLGNFLTTGQNGPNNSAVIMSFAAAQQTFGLLWGSIGSADKIEAGYFGGAGFTTLYTLTGASVLAHNPSIVADSTGDSGSAYVSLATTGAAFTVLRFTSSHWNFELDNVTLYQPAPLLMGDSFLTFGFTAVPEPASMALLGAGLLGLGLGRRRR